MLTPKTLLAETAKFFAIHPDQFITGELVERKDILSATDSDCFCAVGYMAYRLLKEGLISRSEADEAYGAVTHFLKPIALSSDEIYGRNDSLGNPALVVEYLTEQAQNA